MTKHYVIGVFASLSLALCAAETASADPAETCKAGVATESFEGVSADELAGACECLAKETEDNDALQSEIIELSPLPMAERLAKATPDLAAIAQKCFPEAALKIEE